MLPAGLLTEVHPARRNLPGTKPVVFMRAVPITALGTWRIVTAFPIIPWQDIATGTGSYSAMLHKSRRRANKVGRKARLALT
jgi:hypothetical protein